jgi:hypothetical protein
MAAHASSRITTDGTSKVQQVDPFCRGCKVHFARAKPVRDNFYCGPCAENFIQVPLLQSMIQAPHATRNGALDSLRPRAGAVVAERYSMPAATASDTTMWGWAVNCAKAQTLPLMQ